MKSNQYISTLKLIKSEILQSRFNVSRIANKELLFLYYKIGFIISEKVAREKWGNKTLEKLSSDLNNELKGLRGFSLTNLKRMRLFYEEWATYFPNNSFFKEISPLLTDQKKDKEISPLATDQKKEKEISPLATDQFAESFINVSFTSHYEIISKVKTLEERIFYITMAAKEFWKTSVLIYHLKSKLYENRAKFVNNFNKTITASNKQNALLSFLDQYLLDFVRISDEDEDDERILENEIVKNIKKFLMSLGNDFAFIGNQFRLIVEDEEYFIDLLFFNRTLQALVAFELKTGKFKPEYLGKMNFYLSVLDDLVKKPNEQPSIGIILCKEKNNKVVEYAFRDINKSMGVSTYSTSKVLPSEYKNILPDEKTLKELM